MSSNPENPNAQLAQQKANGVAGKFGHIQSVEREGLPNGQDSAFHLPGGPPMDHPRLDEYRAAEVEVHIESAELNSADAALGEAEKSLGKSKGVLSRMFGRHASAEQAFVKAETRYLEQQEEVRKAIETMRAIYPG